MLTLVTDKHYDEQEKKKKGVVVERDDCVDLTFTGNPEARHCLRQSHSISVTGDVGKKPGTNTRSAYNKEPWFLQ